MTDADTVIAPLRWEVFFRLHYVGLRRALRLAAVAAIGLVLGSAFLAENALHVPGSARARLSEGEAIARESRANIEEVRVRAGDGTRLEGWLFTTSHPNGGAVIAMHGVADTRLGMIAHARFLLDAGYTVLTPDSRGHGASGGDLVTYGVREAADVHQWANLLLSRPGVERLYGVGQSMGAAILIQSLACEKRFQALAADCPFATFEEVALYRVAQRGPPELVAWPLVETGMLYARARYGVNLWAASPVGVLRGSSVPVLLIHGTADTNIPIRHSRELHAVDPSGSELWEVEGAAHVSSIGRAPDYGRKVTAFFAAHTRETIGEALRSYRR